MTRVSFVIFVVSLAIPAFASAGVDICSDPRMQSRLSFEYVAFEQNQFDEVSGALDLAYNNYDLLFTAKDDRYLFGVGHRYSIFDINQIQAQTNGHLHTFFVPLHIRTGDHQNSFRLSIAAVMSASSNVIKDPGEYTTDAVQLLAAAIWGRQIDDKLSLRYGICGDHRFGEYQVYPAASLLWQLNPDWYLQLGFPDSRLSFTFSDSLSTDIAIAPDGNEWYVEDSSHTTSSDFTYEAYAVEWSINWHFSEHFAATAGVGRQFKNEYEFTLLDQSVARLSGDSVTRIGAAIEWRF